MAEGKALAQHVMQYRAAISNFPFPNTQADNRPKPQVEMLAFASRRDFARLMKTRHFAAFAQPGLRSTMLVLAPAGGRESLYRNARHEYTHYHLRNHATGFPVWFDEGLAVMLEYLEFSDGDTHARLNTRALFNRYHGTLAQPRKPSLEKMLNTPRVEAWQAKHLPRFYGLMGQLVHMLYFGHEVGLPDFRSALQSYLTSRNNNVPASLQSTHSELGRHLMAYHRKQKPAFEIELIPPNEALQITPMTAVESDQAVASAIEEANPKRAVALYKKVVKAPNHTADNWVDLARAQMGMGDRGAAEKSMAKAQSLLETPNANYLLQQAVMVTRLCDFNDLANCHVVWRKASNIVREALELDPDRIDGLYLQGVLALYRGKPGTGVNYLRAAHRYAPWSPKISFHLGECLRVLGDPSARIHLENAVAWWGDPRWRSMAELALQKASAATQEIAANTPTQSDSLDSVR